MAHGPNVHTHLRLPLNNACTLYCSCMCSVRVRVHHKSPRHIIRIVRISSNNLSVVAACAHLHKRLSIPTLFFFYRIQTNLPSRFIDFFHNFFGMNKEEEMAEQEQMAKLNLDQNKMIKKGGGQRKIIFLAVEVWVDVLGFVRRIQLARSVCLVNFKIYEICWPRLHGNRVMAHRVGPITIGHPHELGQPPTALLLKESKELPFPECLPPDYIAGFVHIRINFLDHEVLAFLSLIAPRINQVRIHFAMKMSNLDENQVASVNQLLQLCREKITTIHIVNFWHCLSNIPFLPDLENKLKIIYCNGIEESDIPILMPFLASPRPDGQQRVMQMHFWVQQLPVVPKLLDAIKEDFRTSTQPMPQPFFIRIKADFLDIPPSGEENPQTNETLTIMPRGNGYFDICRHPRGQYEQWAEDARKRIELPLGNLNTTIIVDILEFGMPFSSP